MPPLDPALFQNMQAQRLMNSVPSAAAGTLRIQCQLAQCLEGLIRASELLTTVRERFYGCEPRPSEEKLPSLDSLPIQNLIEGICEKQREIEKKVSRLLDEL